MTTAKRDELLDAARNALNASRALQESWKSVDLAQLSRSLTPSDIDLVEQLILSRVDVLNAFELLVRCAPGRAEAVLMARYLGKDVSPDTKYGGFLFELDSMLNDWVEVQGKESLRHLFRAVSPERIADARVLTAVRDVLDLRDVDEAHKWLREAT